MTNLPGGVATSLGIDFGILTTLKSQEMLNSISSSSFSVFLFVLLNYSMHEDCHASNFLISASWYDKFLICL